MAFEIKESLKKHYLFEYPINELIDTFILMFEKEKKELILKYEKRLDIIYGELCFSQTVFNISDMIVYKYFNDELSFFDRAFVKCSKFKHLPFHSKIIEIENK